MARNVIYADSAETVAEVRRLLEAHGIKVARASAEADAAAAVERGEARLVIVDQGQARSERSWEARDRERAAPISGGRTDEWSWRDDHSAYERQREELGERYAGRFIAMHRGAVIGVGETAEDAARKGLARLGEPAALFVVRAGDPLPEPEQLDMQMDAPRSIVWEQ